MKNKNEKYHSGFTTPDNYFENFEDKLFDRLNEEQLPENSGFRVPEGYFKGLEDRVMELVHTTETKPKVIPLITKRFIGIAAVAACVVLIVTIFNNKTTISKDFNELQLSSISTYIEEGNIDINSYDIAAMLGGDEILEISADTEQFLEEGLEEYLLETIDENTLLIE